MQDIPDHLSALIASITPDRFYSPREYAEKIGVKPSAVHRAIWRGKPPLFIRIGGTRRATGRAIIEHIVNGATRAPIRRTQPRDGGRFAKVETPQHA